MHLRELFQWRRPAPAPTPAPAPLELVTVDVRNVTLKDLFDARGRFHYMGVFRGHRIGPRTLINRRHVLAAIAVATPEEFRALPPQARKLLAAFLSQEAQRYHGTATRQFTTSYGTKGDPLPKLEFPSRADAQGYRELLRGASKALLGSAVADADIVMR